MADELRLVAASRTLSVRAEMLKALAKEPNLGNADLERIRQLALMARLAAESVLAAAEPGVK